MRDKNSFRQRYKYWKETGELPYSNGLKRDLSNQAQSEDSPVKSGILYPKYDGGKDGLFVKYVDSYRVNPDTGGVYDKVGEVKEGAVILPEVEVVGKPTGIEAMRREYSRISDIQRRQGLSGADPIGQFAVETAALNPVFKLAGTAGLYGLGKYGESLTGFARPQNWARAKLITREMDRSPFGSIGSPVLFPQVRTNVNGFTEDAPTIKWPVGRTAPQITSQSVAKGKFSLGGKYDDLISKMYYQNIISGRAQPNFQFVNGEFIDVNAGKFDNNVKKGLPKYLSEDLLHNTVGRNTRFFANEGTSPAAIERYKDKARQILDDVHVGYYDNFQYDKAGKSDIAGFYDHDSNFISVKRDSEYPLGFVEQHEGRHLLDYKLDDDILMLDTEKFGKDFDFEKDLILMQKAKQKQNMILYDAFDNDFITIPKSKYAGSLKDYPYMSREAVTTNRDARDVILRRHFANEENHVKQNQLIDQLTDDEIFEAVERANGYGRRYIQRLREEGKLTPKKARQFRESMKHVGIYAAPIGFGLSIPTLNNK